MTQYVINIGALPNDGTGDPLRTAFNETNLNFNQVFAAGPVLSNIQIANNTILTTTTNGNLILAPNGIGRIQANATIVPSVANVRDLGSADRRWSTLYVQYANVSRALGVANLTATGDVTVGGNLTVTGNIINVANIVTDAKTIQLANTAGTANAANGSGITVGANDNIATFLYTSTGNCWNTNIGLQVAGVANVASLAVNQTANAWLIGGNSLTAPSKAFWNSDYVNRDEYINSAPDGYISLISRYADGNSASQLHLEHGLATIEVSNGINQVWQFNNDGSLSAPGDIRATSVAVANGVYGEFGAFTGGSDRGLNSIQAGVNTFTFLGSDVIAQFAGNSNAYAQFNFENTSNGTQASGDYVITADNGNDTTHFLNIGITSSNWDGSQPNSLGNRLGPNDGYLYVQDGDMVIGTSNGNIETWKFGTDGTLTTPGNITFPNSYVYRGNTFTSPETNGVLKNFKWEFSDLSYGADTVTLQWNLLDTTFPQWYLTTNSQGNTYVFDGDAKTIGFLDNSINSGTVTFGTAANNGAGNSNDIELTTVTGNAYIRTGSNNWTFDTTGVLTVPGNIVMPPGSSLVGNGASPAPNISGFSSATFGANVTATGNVSGGNLITTGNVSGNTAGYAIGYRDIPQVSFTGNATIATTDAGKHFYSTQSSNYTLTIANNASQGFQVGAAITVVNQGTGTISIAQGSGVTLYLAGNATSGNRSVATFGMATIMKVATDTWFINGTGVS